MLTAKNKPHLHPELWQLNYLFNIGTGSWLVHFFVVTVVLSGFRPVGHSHGQTRRAIFLYLKRIRTSLASS